jgi:hypothetical protein
MKRYIIAVVMIAATIVLGTSCNPEPKVDEKFVAIEKYLEAQNVPGIYVDGATEYAFDRTDGQCYISPSTLTFRIANNTAKKYFEVVLSAAPVVGEKVDVESRSKGVGLSSRTTYKGMTVSKIEDNLCYLVGGADADYVGIIIAWIEE